MADKTIPMDPNMVAFYKGVAAGSRASAELDTPESQARPFEKRSGYFWLRVGVLFAESGCKDQAQFEAFVAGATLRKPERKGFSLHIDTDNAAFHSQDPDVEDFDVYQDGEDRRRELARLLQRLVRDVEIGIEKGTLRASNGNTVGEFQIIDS